METPTPHPSDLMAPMDYDAMAPRSLTEPQAVTGVPGATSHLNITYATVVGWRPLLLDLHVPSSGPGPYPVVVYAHGGGFLGGVKAIGPWHSLPARGIAVASVSYRLSGEVSFPEPVEDVRAAVRWVRANARQYFLDPDRIAGWGSSAGAYLMTMAALSGDEALGRPVGTHQEVSAELSAVVDHHGPADLSQICDDAFENSEEEVAATRSIVRQFLGFDPDAEPERAAATDPVALAARRGQGPPFLIMHGDSDHRVGWEQSARLYEGLAKAGIAAELITVRDADHAAPEFTSREHVVDVLSFLRRTWRFP
ncbi:alpha/beta hydrolase [Streptomyces parvulus]|uniref:Alpha/beta hydrolase n=1 Tax=Streptomyces parvulus TaxID=146923 RepID=A0A369UU50_9ACTN|nr:alpha/beta hydrolase [Streptomyces parvulus]RDD84031.1 alpha/beta hydrolase [Streptomyces parvulus]